MSAAHHFTCHALPARTPLPLQTTLPPAPRPQRRAARLHVCRYVKYNAVLRGQDGNDGPMRTNFIELCKHNRYATTLHLINSAIVKLSKLTQPGITVCAEEYVGGGVP